MAAPHRSSYPILGVLLGALITRLWFVEWHSVAEPSQSSSRSVRCIQALVDLKSKSQLVSHLPYTGLFDNTMEKK